jgi:mannose-6-phosphate isomerase-like protein (cupin superfamily)
MEPFELSTTFVHLSPGSRATPVPDFAWTPEFMAAYGERFAADGAEGRLVCITAQSVTWDSWERHPAGEELVYLLSGRVDVVLDLDGGEHVVALTPGLAMVNPANVWHTAVVHEPGLALFITPGQGTEHRPLA